MTYALVAIVKDEAERIGPLLASVRPHTSYWTIVDTGSSDGTPDLIERGLADIPGRLLHLPFINFGHNRSEAFALAYGTADWLLALDADMTVEIDAAFEPDPAVDAYMLNIHYGTLDYRLPLLLNGRRQWKSVGAVHEYTALIEGRPYVSVPTDQVRITYHGAGRSSVEKLAWQARLLEDELVAQPDNARSTFYLAQTYADLGLHDQARALYGRRAQMVGFEEETFLAAYRAASLEPEWPAKLVSLLAAWERRPHRLEPVYLAARGLNERGQHMAARALLRDLPARNGDYLFVERWVWDWGIDFERSIAEWWAGDRAVSYRLMDDLLARELPDHIRAATVRNRAL